LNQLYTIGQVATITGIKKRTLKYFVERKIIVPSQKQHEGGKEYWLYTNEDIIKIKQVALYRELGYSAQEIKELINSPGFDWRSVLDQQIDALKAKKKNLENLIFASEFMRYVNETETERLDFDISDFDNDIDHFTIRTFGFDEDEITSQSLEKVSADFAEGLSIAEINKHGQNILKMLSKLSKFMHYDPESDEVQNELANIFKYFSSLSENLEFNSTDILFGLRLISNLSMDRIADMLFSTENSTDFLLKALQIYCDQTKEGKLDG